MTDFSEVIKQFKRMCKSVTPIKCTRGECPMGCENIGQCRKVAFERPEKFEEQVMAWAAEHPEPIYPTWWEWLADKGVVDVARMPVDYSGGIITEIKPSGKMYEHIPADIAEKLGLQPKEG